MILFELYNVVTVKDYDNSIFFTNHVTLTALGGHISSIIYKLCFTLSTVVKNTLSIKNVRTILMFTRVNNKIYWWFIRRT